MRLAGALLAPVLAAGCGGQVVDPCRQGTSVTMLVVLDGSGSMHGDGKWAAATTALDGLFDAAEQQADPGFALGLTIFADQHDHTIGAGRAGPYPRPDVAPSFVSAVQYQELRARLDGTQPWLGTPTFEVLSGQIAFLVRATARRRVLVFVTDGVPDPSMPAGADEQPGSIALVRDAQERHGVTTFVVGIGPLGPLASASDYDPRFVGALAVAGGAPRPGCDPQETKDPSRMCHFQVTPGQTLPAQLADALASIQTAAAACP